MLPTLTHLQAHVIQLIAKNEHSGRFIRSSLEDVGVRTSAAAFYQLMSRMEKADLIAGHYLISVVDGQTIKERRYHATINGMTQFLETANYYGSAKKKSRISPILAEALASGPKNSIA